MNNKLRFLMMRFWYEIPIIGTFDRLLKDSQQIEGTRWSTAERILCADYYRFAGTIKADKEAWEKSTSYLAKVQELGRSEFPWFGWLFIMILLVAESASFGILLTDYISNDLTAKDKVWLGYSLATVLALMLLILTHATGRQLHRNSLIKKARQWFINRPDHEKNKTLRPFPDVCLDHNEMDDEEPIYVQVISRVQGIGGKCQLNYLMPLVCLIIVFGIGATAYHMRLSIHHKQILQAAIEAKMEASITDDSADVNDLLGIEEENISPEDLKTIAADETSIANGAFGILSFLYGAMQFVSVFIGYTYGFSGKESRAAMHLRSHFSSQESFLKFHQDRFDNVARLAQAKLERLQHQMRLADNDGLESLEHKMTFYAYVSEQMKQQYFQDQYPSFNQQKYPVYLKSIGIN